MAEIYLKVRLSDMKSSLELISSEKGKYVWQDSQSSRFRLKASVPNPWGQEWKLVPMTDQQHREDEQEIRRVTFTLWPVEEGDSIPVKLDRTEGRGWVYDSLPCPIRSWCHFVNGTQIIYDIQLADDDPSDVLLQRVWEFGNLL